MTRFPALPCGFAALLASGAPCLPAQGRPAVPPPAQAAFRGPLPAPSRVASVEGITEYRLANGLRVLLFPDPSRTTITVNVTYLVGSRHENEGETGMAHLLEHMVFRGTDRFPGDRGTRTPVDILNELGASFNGTTTWDRTNYYVTFPATEANLDQVLDLEVERMGRSLIRTADLWDPARKRGEMAVVRNEYELGENSPFDVTFKRALAAAYDWHPYGKPVIGCRSDIENVDIDRLRMFYHLHYAPDNAVLLVTGRIDETQALAKVNERFGRILRPARKLTPSQTREPVQDGERYVAVRRPGETPVLLAGYKIPASADGRSAAVQVLAQIMAGAPHGRLHKALVEGGKGALVFPMNQGLREPGLLFFGAILAKGQDAEEAKGLLIRTLEDASRPAATQEEVDRARTELLKGCDRILEDSANLGIHLSEFIAQGDWRLFFLNRDRIQAVTPSDVQGAMKGLLVASNRTLAEFVPTADPVRAELPEIPDVAAMVKGYKGRPALPQGEAFDAGFGAIEGRVLRKALPCGLKAAVVPRKARGGRVTVGLNLRFGDERSLEGQAIAGRLCASMLLRGAAGRSRQQIKDELDRLKAEAFIGGGGEGAYVHLDVPAANLPEAARLVTEALRRPAFPQAEFEQLRKEEIAMVQYFRSDPQAMASRWWSATVKPWPKGHVKRTVTFEEELAQLEALDVKDAAAFHRRFFGAQGELCISGDVDPGAALELWNGLLEGWKAEVAYERIPGRVFPVPAQERTLASADKAGACLVAGLAFPLRDDDPDWPALVLGNWILGGGALKGRLPDRIRQQEGLAYMVGSNVSASSQDPEASWCFLATCAPGNLEALQRALKEELARALKDGFTPREIAEARTAWKQSGEVGRSQDTGLVQVLLAAQEAGRTLAFDAGLETKVMALDNERILAALRRHLDPDKLVVVRTGDLRP